VFQKEEETDFKVFEDGHIEVSLTTNIYEYAAWTGVSILQRTGTVPEYSWFLFIHDTSEFFQDSGMYINNILNTYHETNTDIVWLSSTGQCNICLIRKAGISEGNKLYSGLTEISKKLAIQGEWAHEESRFVGSICPKFLKVNQVFVKDVNIILGYKSVYGKTLREVLYFPSIRFQKYIVPNVVDTKDHPHRP
jgi:hypothetical protein